VGVCFGKLRQNQMDRNKRGTSLFPQNARQKCRTATTCCSGHSLENPVPDNDQQRFGLAGDRRMRRRRALGGLAVATFLHSFYENLSDFVLENEIIENWAVRFLLNKGGRSFILMDLFRRFVFCTQYPPPTVRNLLAWLALRCTWRP
jgi:hypothetical protein